MAQRGPVPPRFRAKTRGEGDQPNDCCQTCGEYLTDACYAKTRAKSVPRKNKICPDCFETLLSSKQEEYYRYEYGRYEPRGTGWNPDKPDRRHR